MGGLSADHLPLAGPGSAGLSRTGTHENRLGYGSGVRLGGTILMKSLGHQGRGGRGRDGSPPLLLPRLLKHQRRAGQAFLFHSMGMSHLAFAVEDGVANALAEAEGTGIRLIDKAPRKGAEGLNIAFLHPKSTLGVLTELCENPNK